MAFNIDRNNLIPPSAPPGIGKSHDENIPPPSTALTLGTSLDGATACDTTPDEVKEIQELPYPKWNPQCNHVSSTITYCREVDHTFDHNTSHPFSIDVPAKIYTQLGGKDTNKQSYRCSILHVESIVAAKIDEKRIIDLQPFHDELNWHIQSLRTRAYFRAKSLKGCDELDILYSNVCAIRAFVGQHVETTRAKAQWFNGWLCWVVFDTSLKYCEMCVVEETGTFFKRYEFPLCEIGWKTTIKAVKGWKTAEQT